MPRLIPNLLERPEGHPPLCEWNEPHPITGATWEDMPGTEQVLKKCNYALYRRGLLVENTDGQKQGLGVGTIGPHSIERKGIEREILLGDSWSATHSAA